MHRVRSKIQVLQVKSVREVVIENVNALRAAFPALKPMLVLSKKAGVGKSTIERMTKVGNCEVESLEAVAKAFGLQPWQLLVPNLDPENPPQIGSITPEMESSLAKARHLAKEVIKLSEGA